ncbi:MAG TPA: hypothetical protein PLD14_01015 [Candidatus Pacearchaeota archaeon]|mgnify:CR=1 FL=1|nr:hypothetical protein [Candidatus Pacearchaeota archaeon]HPR79780.1 hypothetical protein [Candidatus Pacearchaeota archaeon]
MQYRVPQFIEHEAKILGPLNIKQSLLVGGVLAACFFMYFSIGKTNFFLFLLIAAGLVGLALAISFTKIEGQELPIVVKNWANFNTNPKIFLWKRKQSPVFLSTERTRRDITTKQAERSPLRVKQEGRIGDMIKKIDFEK